MDMFVMFCSTMLYHVLYLVALPDLCRYRCPSLARGTMCNASCCHDFASSPKMQLFYVAAPAVPCQVKAILEPFGSCMSNLTSQLFMLLQL